MNVEPRERVQAAPSPPAQPQAQAPTGEAPAEVPERPSLADGVQLSGNMEESAFVEPQYFVQRDGQFVQLTELLYRVAGQVDGQKSLEEIAQAVGDEIDREVTAENVRQLIGQKLIPLGLVQKADGSAEKPRGEAGRSPLAVNMKMAMISPKLIEPITALLQWLFWPPVLIVLTAAGLAAQGWLYFVHGVAGGVHDAIYNPGLLLGALAILVVATGFHEFGHAAALRYGGGKVRGMGVGLYLAYPAFYTDVTDNYRLGRWARVRTDLGGIYFNVIAALGLIGAYMLTGSEFLLVSVLLLNFQTVQQFFPFVRLDGYWTLADITGIPDFFTHMTAFIRSVLPIPGWKGRKLPELKWWGKAVFAGYILIVVPLLAFLLFMAVRAFPRLLASAWDSLRQQTGNLSNAFAGGDVGGVLLYALYIAVLAIPVLGLVYMLYSLGKMAVTWAYKWSEDSPRKRVLANVGLGAAAVFLVGMWAPQLPFAPPGVAGPLYAYTYNEWTPIAPDERGTVSDALAGVIVSVPIAEGRDASAVERATATALAGTPSPEASPAGDTTPGPGTPGPGTPAEPAKSGAQPTAAETPAAAPTEAATPSVQPAAAPPTATPAPPPPTATPVPAQPAAPPPASGGSTGTSPGTTTGGTTAPAPTAPPATAAPPPATATPVPAGGEATAVAVVATAVVPAVGDVATVGAVAAAGDVAAAAVGLLLPEVAPPSQALSASARATTRAAGQVSGRRGKTLTSASPSA